MKVPTHEQQLEWVKQYKAAALELEKQRHTALNSLTKEQTLRKIDALLSLPVANRRRESSGLVEQQAIFQRGRKP